MTDAERIQFIEQIAVFVQKHAPTYGILVHSPIIAQACLESAYGTSNKAQYHNYFGLKYRGDRVTCASGYFSDTSSEQNADGSYITITTDWYKFDNMDSGVEGYFQFTNIANYDNLKGVTDPRTYLENIKADGYATSINYVDNVMAVIDKWDLTKYDSPIEQRGIKVAIDAGHGSNTAGKRHPDGYREHWSDTYMAFYLNQILVKNGFETFKTSWDDDNPTDDEDIELAIRQAQIKAFGADISVSIHANAYGDGASYNSAEGVSTHYHSNTSRVGDSVALATAIQNELIKNTTQKNRGIVAQELAMCNCVAMGTQASVLMETAFMTNSRESALLQSDEFCVECAREIAQGIFNYFGITDADANVYVVAADRSHTDEDDKDIINATVTLDNPVVEYYGNINCPAPTVVYDGTTLSINVDYTVQYSNNINAGIGIVTITGIGKYTGTKNVEFTIKARDIGTASWVYSTDADNCINIDQLGLTCIGMTLVKNTDYTLEVSYKDHEGYKLAICNAYGKGNYYGSINGGFFVEKYPEDPKIDINSISFSIDQNDFIYDGNVHKPEVSNTGGLIVNTDYTVTYNGTFIDAGNYKVIVTGINSYEGTITFSVTIHRKEISKNNFTISQNYFIYDGSMHKPDVTNNIGLIANNDYTVSYNGAFINAGEYTVDIVGVNNYIGSISFPVTIDRKEISKDDFNVASNLTYNGSVQKPIVKSLKGYSINTDYNVEYIGDFINVGQYTVNITGIGNYIGSVTYSVTINRKDINNISFTISDNIYNGSQQTPIITTSEKIVEGQDYSVVYIGDMINVGTYDIIISGINNYTGNVNTVAKIVPKSITYDDFDIYPKTFIYNGDSKDVSISSSLRLGNDYTVSTEEDMVSVGPKTLTFQGIGNYTGTITDSIEILPCNIDSIYFTVEPDSAVYYGGTLYPIISCGNGLIEGTDYKVSYKGKFIEVGNYQTIITGIGNYTGERSFDMVITKRELSTVTIDIETDSKGFYIIDTLRLYTETEELVAGEDYSLTISYTNNFATSYKEATIKITGINNYNGTITKVYNVSDIEYIDINDCIIMVNIPGTIYYSGFANRPEVTVKYGNKLLTENIEYKVEYKDNINAGNAKVTISGIGLYVNSKTEIFIIQRQNITNRVITIEQTSYYFTGKDITPAVQVEGLKQGSDYTVTYKDNKYPGTAKIIVNGTNNYIGTLETEFTIEGENISDCIAEYGTPSKYTEYRVEGAFNLYADLESYQAKEALIVGIDYIIAHESRTEYSEYTLVGILVEGCNLYTGQHRYSFRVIDKDEPPRDIPDDDNGVYNFGYLNIPGSETAVGDYDFGCLDCGIDPETVVIDEKDYDFNILCGDGQYGISPGDIFTLKNTSIYTTCNAEEVAFKCNKTIYIYDNIIVNGRVRVARIEDAVDSPARVFGWVVIDDIKKLNILPIGEKVIVTGKIYENPDGTGSYIEKSEATMYISGHVNGIEENKFQYPYIVSTTKTSRMLGYVSRLSIVQYSDTF